MAQRSTQSDRAAARRSTPAREALIGTIGGEVVRFQDASNELDDAAAAVLALTRTDLPCISMLLFAGSAPVGQLGEGLRLGPRAMREVLERIELAGYARRVVTGTQTRVELTEHARHWIETLWGPIQVEAVRLLEAQTTRDLAVIARFMQTIAPMQAAHAARMRALLDVPKTGARSNRLRGGLAPAVLRRVQLFVVANLERPIPLSDLAARAGLSEFHFARAFRSATGTTPRVFVERARIERAKELLGESDLSLAEVAARTGLGSQSRFTTTFRKATGFTPATYRRGRS
jgi:AraC family transcriptional regulator